MPSGVELTRLSDNLSILDQAIVAELASRRITPTLVLLHSALDTVGWLASDKPLASRRSFCEWVNRYLFKSGDFECTAIDLYAARCGLLHTLSPDSKLADAGDARQICWAWGNASLDDLRASIEETGGESLYVAVHVDSLISAWQKGVAKFLGDLRQNPARANHASAKADRFFRHLSKNFVSEFVEFVRAPPDVDPP